MPALLSLVTSVKDYIEIAHKLVETQNGAGGAMNSLNIASDNFLAIRDYNEFGAVLTYVVLSIKQFLIQFFSFGWLNNIWSLPLIVPDIASAMISEISVLDSYFTNAFSFLDNGMSASGAGGALSAQNIGIMAPSGPLDNLVAIQKANQNPFLFGFEKFIIGLLNSFFLFLPTSTAHLITLRRFVMQGVEAGFLAGLGTLAGNFVWLASIILGLRFIVIPWLSLDIFRYVLGFLLLVKYLWECSKELNKTTNSSISNNSKTQIFLLNFLLALTEQTSIYPFISNMSFGSEGSIIEGFSGTLFSSGNLMQFYGIHMCYLLGILLGSFSLLQFTVWFWENPAFSIYMWLSSNPAYSGARSALGKSTGWGSSGAGGYKVLNFVFLYLTMLCAISSIPYFGLDYTITNPLGFIPQDRMISQKSDPATGGGEPLLQETSFLGVKPTDKNSRIKEGVHARRERWKERLVKYQAFDASLYDQGVYDILTVEDLNYGFDRFWLRRKMRNHQIRFRLFPGPWMRSVKKQLNKPGFTGPRMEFFRILFEQYYHPSFMAQADSKGPKKARMETTSLAASSLGPNGQTPGRYGWGFSPNGEGPTGLNTIKTQKGLVTEYSALRKFARNVNTRVNSSLANYEPGTLYPDTKQMIYSKSFKSLFNSINKEFTQENLKTFRDLSKNVLLPKSTKQLQVNFTSPQNQGKLPVWLNQGSLDSKQAIQNKASGSNYGVPSTSLKQFNIRKKLSKKERLLFMQKAQLAKAFAVGASTPQNNTTISPLGGNRVMPEPLNYYFQKNEAFKRKLKYYSTISTRKFAVGNNAPYFKSLLKRSFFYYKPSLRFKRTMFTAALRRGFRKKSVTPKKLLYTTNSLTSTNRYQNPQVFRDSKTTGIQDTLSASGLATGVNLDKTSSYPATSQYSVLGKRASRYRYQIYKDVLQHWYYTPFNRLLLKFDVDSFMNRQPKSHFLTKNEERLLHLRRVLLAEHYNTLRWYTYMQHYRTMKSRIGGAKSFASGSYNQQFQGTFKKIRHLFAITPIQAGQTGNLSVLKFDQPLFNESNTSQNVLTKATAELRQPEPSLSGGPDGLKALNPSSPRSAKAKMTSSPYTHEDLSQKGGPATLADSSSKNPQGQNGQDFIDKSLTVTSQYVIQEQLNKMNQMKQYINQKSYSSITNLLANPEMTSPPSGAENLVAGISLGSLNNGRGAAINQDLSAESYPKVLLLDLLKQAKARLNDQTFLKNYISHRIEKREQRSKSTSKEVTAQLASLKNWLSPINSMALAPIMSKAIYGATDDRPLQNSEGLTTGARKAVNDGVFVLNKMLSNPAMQTKSFITKQTKNLKIQNQGPNAAKYYINLDSEKQIKQALTSLKELNTVVKKLQKNNGGAGLTIVDQNGRNSILIPEARSALRKTVRISRTVINTILKPFFVLQNGLLVKRNHKNLEWWRQKQRSITKRKSSRKKSRAKNIKQVYQKNQPNTGGANDSLSQRRYEDWKENNRGILDNSIQISPLLNTNLSLSKESTLLGSQSGLRKKRVEQDSLDPQNNVGQAPLLGSVKKAFNNYFLLKFRKKASSKGRRYRNMSMSRGFAYVRKPKNLNSFTTIPEYLNSFETVLGAKTINNITKTYSQEILQKPLLSKEEKAVFLKDFKTKLTKTVFQKTGPTGPFRLLNTIRETKGASMTPMAAWSNVNNLKNLLMQGQIKKSVGKKRSRRTWKKRKRQKFTKNHYKYRKRQLHGLGKLRVLMKKVKRIKATHEFQHWWWNTYLPKMVNKGYGPLSSKSIASRDGVAADGAINSNKTPSLSGAGGPISQSSFGSFKPLSSTKALEIRSSLYPNAYDAKDAKEKVTKADGAVVWDKPQTIDQERTLDSFGAERIAILDKIYTNFVDTTFGQKSSSLTESSATYAPKYNVTTTIPFYAGWDESLRKFVVTNRILSRRDAGFAFSQAPLQGLNEASYLYLQSEMPFNSYIIDQFIPNNQSFYAPLGWSRFQFRHTLLNSWVQKTKSQTTSSNKAQKSLFSSGNNGYGPTALLPVHTHFEYFNSATVGSGESSQKNFASSNKESSKLQNRRIKKRYSLLKQSPIQLSYVPSGSLLAETLPSHYISVFDKQARMPRTRYIKRNLPKANSAPKANLDSQIGSTVSSNVKDLTILDYSTNWANQNTRNLSLMGATASLDSTTNLGQENINFTLRKRIKPKRKYHKKRFVKKDGLIFPRRRKFGITELQEPQYTKAESSTQNGPSQQVNSNFRLRPSTRINQTSIKALSSKSKKGRTPAKTNPVRLRQLRRREFQQVFKPLQRFQPRYGGFTWPGDYLRLESIPMPKLEPQTLITPNNLNILEDTTNLSKVSSGATAQSNQAKLKRKINVQPIGLLPRKYLLQKHNLKVFKKKLALKYMA